MILRRIFLASILFALCVNAAIRTVIASDNLASPPNNIWIPGWKKTNAMTIARAGAAAVSHGNRVYLIGGVDGASFLNTIESAQINADGSLSRWVVISKMPEARGFMSAVIYKERMYVVGGANGSYGKNLLSSIVSAPILKTGLLGNWRTEKEKLLTPRRCSKLFVKDNVLHVLGGFGGALLDTVETSRFAMSGVLEPWVLQEKTMTMPRYVNEVKRVGDYALVVGGHHPTQGKGMAEVEYAHLSEGDISWRTATPMNTGRYAFASATYKQMLYVFGGISGAEYLNSSERIFVDRNIASNKWVKSVNLPEFMANFTTLVKDNRIYLVGGSTRYRYMSNVWWATFNESGDVGYYGTSQELDDFYSQNTVNENATLLPNSGIVLERIETDSYTYMRVLTHGKEIWLAAPETDVSVNTKIRFSEGVYMSNFRSKSLKRNFPAILFVGSVSIENRD